MAAAGFPGAAFCCYRLGWAMKEKIALITGGTSGIGLASAQRLSCKGWQVFVMGRDAARGQAAERELNTTVGRNKCRYIQGDVAKRDACRQAVQNVIEATGGLDLLVNSAGIYLERAIEDMSEADFDEIMNVNVRGTYFMTQQAVMEMKKKGGGTVLNISSDAGVHGNMLCSAYCASKGAVNLFTKAMALELATYNIRINSICPGDVLTPLTESQLEQYPDRARALKEMASVYPLGRIGTPEEIAAVVDFLASEEAGFITGAIWTVDGGITA